MAPVSAASKWISWIRADGSSRVAERAKCSLSSLLQVSKNVLLNLIKDFDGFGQLVYSAYCIISGGYEG